MIFPENNYPGNEVIAFIQNHYKNIYKDEKDEYGINTNLKTKPEMFLKLKQGLRDKLIKVNSEILYSQLFEYPAEDVLTITQDDAQGGHFDVLMAGVMPIYRYAEVTITQKESVSDRVMERAVNSSFQQNVNNR